ncbi:2466_t:CDS:1, partial [Cetraspora pellucida]
NQKCDTSLTTWSCTCESNTACPRDSKCYKGHCVLGNFTYDNGVNVGTCDHSTLKVIFVGICKFVIKKLALFSNSTVKVLTSECAAAVTFLLTDEIVLPVCGAIIGYIIATSTGVNSNAEVTCDNAWSSV